MAHIEREKTMKHTLIDGLWRITDDNGKPLMNGGKPVDNGGHELLCDSQTHVKVFNVQEPRGKKK